jgi:RNA polymerase sigma factor (sigma-70 family)
VTQEALLAVIERNRKYAYSIINHRYLWLTKFGYDLEDLIQEAIYAIIIAAPAYRASFASETTYYGRCIINWFESRIVRPMHAEHRRGNLHTVSLDLPIDSTYGKSTLLKLLPDHAPHFESAIDARVSVHAALDWLKTLHPQQVQAIRLYYIEGMTLEEAGKVMGITRSRVHQHVHRGIKNLRKYMIGETKGEQNERSK